MNRSPTLLLRAHYQRLEEQYLLQLFASDLSGKSVLDVGCGEGKYMRLLGGRCSRIVGIDANRDQVDGLQREGFEAFLPESLPRQRYDVILMSHVIEHMSAPDLVAFMDRYLPLLADDGKLIVLTPLPGLRFWHDYTHVRPYTPQSLGMMFGILGAPAAFRPKVRMQLQEIRFFRDSWRIRHSRHYYPSTLRQDHAPGARWNSKLISAANTALAGLHVVSAGRLGPLASWAGVYRIAAAEPEAQS
ncbi:class I SAM-dependent methyltransferase [Paracidovorax sp. MALMAid1276]|uniref:class I SAM-dependent methyltransferase n=1 Tax=Paracidovorax sp. MALMAid1276 TaxID=3411631 RepID=UPI003B9BE59B